jgi:prepilin-type processing-associated H-X9-DG protein
VAKRSSCQSNLKQIALAGLIYSDDYNDFIIPDITDDNVLMWPENLAENGYLAGVKLPLSIEMKAVFRCPAEDRASMGGKTEWNTWKGTHFGVNRYLSRAKGSAASQPRLWIPMGKLKTPSTTYFFGDKWEGNQPLPHTYHLRARYYYPALRHASGWNVSMLDGHVDYSKTYPKAGQASDYGSLAAPVPEWDPY